MGLSGAGSTSTGARSIIPLLYGVLIVAIVALLTLLLADLIPETDELRHLFVFDLAWPVFLVASVATFIGGVWALVASRGGRSSALRRYAWWALGYSVIAIAVLFLLAGFELS